MQIICQQLAHAQSYCLFAALGIAEVILLRALPPGLMQNVPANIVRSASTTDPQVSGRAEGTLTGPGLSALALYQPYCAVRL
jgi:hypothetical protein